MFLHTYIHTPLSHTLLLLLRSVYRNEVHIVIVTTFCSLFSLFICFVTSSEPPFFPRVPYCYHGIGLIEENDGPGDDDKMIEGKKETKQNHAVTHSSLDIILPPFISIVFNLA